MAATAVCPSCGTVGHAHLFALFGRVEERIQEYEALIRQQRETLMTLYPRRSRLIKSLVSFLEMRIVANENTLHRLQAYQRELMEEGAIDCLFANV